MVLLHSSGPVGGTPTGDIKGLRDYALVLLGLNTSRDLYDIAALRWNDLSIQNATITIHWRHAHGQAHDEHLPSFVSNALLSYLHALYGTNFAGVQADTPLWVGLRRAGDQIMLSTRAIAAIYREYLGYTQSHALQARFAATDANRIRDEQAKAARATTHALLRTADEQVSPIRATASAALSAMLHAPIETLSAIAPNDVDALRQEIARRKSTESKSATIRDLWQAKGGKRFLAASRLYMLLL